MNAKILGNRLIAPLLAVLMVFAMLFAVSTLGPASGLATGEGVAIGLAADMVITPIITHVTTPHVPILEITAVGFTLAVTTGLLWIRRSAYPHDVAKLVRGFWSSNYGMHRFWQSNYDPDFGLHQGALAGGDYPKGSLHFVRTS